MAAIYIMHACMSKIFYLIVININISRYERFVFNKTPNIKCLEVLLNTNHSYSD